MLDILQVRDAEALTRFNEITMDVVPSAGATKLVFVGDGNLVEANYDNPTSLLWRDAGVLMQTLALVSTAYRLAFCPLGILGSEVINALDLHGSAALGVALIGRKLIRN